MPLPTPFHARTSRSCTSLFWKECAGFHAVRSYYTCHERHVVADSEAQSRAGHRRGGFRRGRHRSADRGDRRVPPAQGAGGQIHQGEHALDQLLVRPVPECARYATPLDGLYLCGSGAHPGGGLTCLPGMHAASAVLAARRSG